MAEPTADRVVAPLRAARVPLHDGLQQLQAAASAVPGPDAGAALAALDAAVAYLRELLLPVCRAEEFTLFTAVDGVLGAPGACDIMKAQHASIAAMADDLRRVVEAARKDGDVAAYGRYLFPLLHGLYALVRAHVEAEDDAYLSLLDSHLSESQVEVIVKNVGRLTAGARPATGIEFPRL